MGEGFDGEAKVRPIETMIFKQRHEGGEIKSHVDI